MKRKGWIIIGIIAAIAAGTVIPIAVATNAQVRKLQAYLKGETTLTKKEFEVLDLDHNGTLNAVDLLLAKKDALLHKNDPMTEVYAPAVANVKQIGRTYYHEETKTLWCSHSGSGIAFTFEGTDCILTLVGDSQYASGAAAARYAVYLNDQMVMDAQVTEAETEITILHSETIQYAEVRVIKLSEAAQSSFGIKDITVTAKEGIMPAAAKAHTIEFIGDSITCGYGVDDENPAGGFKTLTENVTRTYAYLTADTLQADYSMVSFSGYGIVSGYTNNNERNKTALVPRYYDKLGFSFGVLEQKKKPQDIPWDFSDTPELIVVNLGTNDASYTGTDPVRQQEYIDGYVAFLKTIRQKNPDVPILCTLGIMGDTLCASMEAAVAQYCTETGDSKINSMRFAMQSAEDGYAVDWHPTAATHAKAADTLTDFIRIWLGWE